MNIKDQSQIKESLNTLMSLCRKKSLISDIEYSAYVKLGKSEPLIIFGLLCKKIYSLGAANLFKKHGDIMQTLNVCYPTFTKFIGRVTLSKPDFGKRKIYLFPSQADGLVEIAFEDGLITEEEKDLYKELISFDSDIIYDIEMDILLKVKDLNYDELKNKAPQIFEYIKRYYPDYFEKLAQPHIDAIKKRVL